VSHSLEKAQERHVSTVIFSPRSPKVTYVFTWCGIKISVVFSRVRVTIDETEEQARARQRALEPLMNECMVPSMRMRNM
jgi:hypothetical protein